jgi:hypothetical protein
MGNPLSSHERYLSASTPSPLACPQENPAVSENNPPAPPPAPDRSTPEELEKSVQKAKDVKMWRM